MAQGEFNDYFHELNDIEKDNESVRPPDEELPKTPDEGEQEVAWLKDAGYGHLVSKMEDGEDIDEATVAKETKALTDVQAAAVKKRIDTLNATFKKQKRQKRADVRSVFNAPTQANQDTAANTKADAAPNLSKTPSTRGRPERRKTKRAPFLRRRGEYSMTGNSSAIVDGMVSQGISMLYVHPTDVEMYDTASPQSPSNNVDVISRACANGHHLALADTQSNHSDSSSLPDLIATDNDDGLGITRIEDLSKQDLAKVQPLVLIELTALFDQQGLTFIRRKARSRFKDVGLFGVPLSVLLEHDKKRCPKLKVPFIFQEFIKYLSSRGLHEEGILRVPGAVNRVKSLRQELEMQYKRGKLELNDSVSVHDAAGLLKQFLRELPNPLLTYEYLEAFRQVEKIDEPRQRVEALNFLVLLLPDVHRNTLEMLLRFLQEVVSVESNKMTLGNVAMIMAPNLFFSTSIQRQSVASARRTPKPGKDLIEVSMAAETSNVVQLLIHYQDLLWLVPPYVITQVRSQYQHESTLSRDSKSLMKLLGKKEKQELRKKPSSASELLTRSQVIRVNAPQLSKFNATLYLDQQLTAADVLARFSSTPELARSRDSGTWESSSGDEVDGGGGSASPSPSTHSIHLYEVGGNIGERRLNLDTNIMSLYRVNPNAELVVRMEQSS